MTEPRDDIRKRWGLRQLINVAGTNTVLGASKAHPVAIKAMVAMAGESVDIHELQAYASRVIARAANTEAGCVTASVAAGISVAVAGAMTGAQLGRIEQLPDTTGMKNEVVLQAGQVVHYGAPLEQNIRLTGAKVVVVGNATRVMPYQLETKLSERTAAAVYVHSHHSVQFGQIPFPQFARICKQRGVPVIVDLANEQDLRGYPEHGADITLHSAHKFLNAPTAGILAGKKALVRAAYLQTFGLGRGMKVGKESIAGALAALEVWEKRDTAAIVTQRRCILDYWRESLEGRQGISTSIRPDETGNPIERLSITVDPAQANLTAFDLSSALAKGDPPIVARDHEVEHGWFELDPGHLHPGEEKIVVSKIIAELGAARERAPLTPNKSGEFLQTNFANFDKFLTWPDESA